MKINGSLYAKFINIQARLLKSVNAHASGQCRHGYIHVYGISLGMRLRRCKLYIQSNSDFFSAMFTKETNYYDFRFAFLHIMALLKNGYTLKGKNLLPSGRKFLLFSGANSLLLDKIPFEKRTKSI